MLVSYFLKRNMHINMYKFFLKHLAMITQMWAYIFFFILYCVFKCCAMNMHLFHFYIQEKN